LSSVDGTGGAVAVATSVASSTTMTTGTPIVNAVVVFATGTSYSSSGEGGIAEGKGGRRQRAANIRGGRRRRWFVVER